MTAVKITGLEKNYVQDGFTLKIDNLNISEGSVFGLLGPNGSGKTTLLNIMLNLIKPNKGTVAIFNQDAINIAALLNSISYMPENKNLYENMTVTQMINFATKIVPNIDLDKLNKLIEIFPLDKKQKISTLSYGEKTQLYSIIVFAKKAKLLILDEPTRGLDPIMQERMLHLIKEESIAGKTILFSSHQILEVEETADSIAIIKNGEIIIDGFVDDLKTNLLMLVTTNGELPLLKSIVTEVISIRNTNQQNFVLISNQPNIQDEISKKLSSTQVIKPNLKDIFLTTVEGRRN